MSPQAGICAEANVHALFLILDRRSGADPTRIAEALGEVSELNAEIAALDPSAELHAVVAVGDKIWDDLYPRARPAHLKPFPEMGRDSLHMPDTPADLLFHIHSARRDLTFESGRRIYARLAQDMAVVEEVLGFRYMDSRDLIGFVDGTENPQGEDRPGVALVSDDGPFNGGSYLHAQRFVHDLEKWNQLEVKEQERVIGRTKVDNIEFARADKSPHAHTLRTSLKDADGKSIEILRHSMPYGAVTESGLFFMAYAATPENFTSMLRSMVEGDEQGNRDHLMNYTSAVSGMSFFAPPVSFLQNPTG
ncbi:MAG: Dyp-type peroxidase [Acidobacteriota bacterium]|nr:Dyp-type peroxidase [Acidobacteriota bacterium]